MKKNIVVVARSDSDDGGPLMVVHTPSAKSW